MHNVLVGLDGTRRAEVAVKQALTLAEPLKARIHLLQPIEPEGPAVEIPGVGRPDDPLAVIDRNEALARGEEEPLLMPDDDVSAAAVKMCESAGVVCTYQRLHGDAAQVLREQAMGMDLLVLPRFGGGGLGRTATRLASWPVTATLLCRDEVIPWRSLLLAYEPSAPGGRALRMAGELSAELNLSLDVIVADPNKDQARRRLEYVRKALRAFHVDGELVLRQGRTEDVLESVVLEQQPSALVVPFSPRCLFPWAPPTMVRRALQFPNALPLIVP